MWGNTELEVGHYYLYDGPTWLSDEIRYGETLKYVGPSNLFFADVQKLGQENGVVHFNVPTQHLKPLRSLRDPSVKVDQIIHSDPYIKTSAEGITMEDLNKGHVTTLEEHLANPQRIRNVRVDFARFMEYIGTILPAGKSRDNAFERLHEASMWAHKAMEEMATKEEPSREMKVNLPAEESELSPIAKFTMMKAMYHGAGEGFDKLDDADLARRMVGDGQLKMTEYITIFGADAWTYQ